MDRHQRLFLKKQTVFRSIYCRKMPNILSKVNGKFDIKERKCRERSG